MNRKKNNKTIKPIKIKKLTTNIKPNDIVYTNIKREILSSEILENQVKVYKEDKESNLINLSNLGNNESVEIAKELSTLRYRIENPYVTDLCCAIYTQLTTQPKHSINKLFYKVERTKNNGIKFFIEKTNLIRLTMGDAVSETGFAHDGCYNTRKQIMLILNPILSGKAVVPMQIISLKNYKLENGETKNLIIKVPPLKIHSILIDEDRGLEHIEIELNGLLYPIKWYNGNFKTNTSYLHVPSNLSVLLSVGEDLYLQSEQYQKTKKKSKFDVARKFIDLIQLGYNQEYNIPDTYSKIEGNKFILMVWGDTLKSLLPSAFRTKNSIRRNEIVTTANLAATYFHYGIEHLNKTTDIKHSNFLVTPCKKEFCQMEKSSEFAIFTAYIY